MSLIILIKPAQNLTNQQHYWDRNETTPRTSRGRLPKCRFQMQSKMKHWNECDLFIMMQPFNFIIPTRSIFFFFRKRPNVCVRPRRWAWARPVTCEVCKCYCVMYLNLCASRSEWDEVCGRVRRVCVASLFFFCFFFTLSLSVFISLLRYQTFLVLQNIAPLTSGLSQ